MEDLEILGEMGVDVIGYWEWLFSVWIDVGVGSLEQIFSNEVWEIWVANPLAKTMQAVGVVRSYPQWGQEGCQGHSTHDTPSELKTCKSS